MEEDGVGKFKRICVFCGSRTGNKPSFSDAALELGKKMVEKKINLVYGGGSVGLMGLISRTVHDGGCHVLGVIPTALMAQEIAGETIGETKIVADMHERKSEMAKHADAFIALPGGYGTMEELLEMIAWSQLGIHDKPVGLLNVDGYYNSLLALFDKGVEEGFIMASARNIVVSAETVEELILKMEVCIGEPAVREAFWLKIVYSVSHAVAPVLSSAEVVVARQTVFMHHSMRELLLDKAGKRMDTNN